MTAARFMKKDSEKFFVGSVEEIDTFRLLDFFESAGVSPEMEKMIYQRIVGELNFLRLKMAQASADFQIEIKEYLQDLADKYIYILEQNPIEKTAPERVYLFNYLVELRDNFNLSRPESSELSP